MAAIRNWCDASAYPRSVHGVGDDEGCAVLGVDGVAFAVDRLAAGLRPARAGLDAVVPVAADDKAVGAFRHPGDAGGIDDEPVGARPRDIDRLDRRGAGGAEA